MQSNRPNEVTAAGELNDVPPPVYSGPGEDPEILALRRTTTLEINDALAGLPASLREVVVLRELEGMSYKEIAAIIDAPMGTVMSRLARARADLRRVLRRSRCSKDKQ